MDLLKKIQKEIEGDVKEDLMTRHIYAVDASIYEIPPLGVVLPKTKEDICATLCLAHEAHVPVTARGAGTGTAGSALGSGLILDTSRYMTQIKEVTSDFACVEPGVIQDDLNKALMPFLRRLGPDSATGNRATLGGMLSTNAAGTHSLRYGSMKDHVLEVELVLSNGECVRLGKENPSWIEAKMEEMTRAYQDEIRAHFPKIRRRSSGYNLDVLLEKPRNLAQLIAGSEGTLGVLTEIKLATAPLLKESSFLLIPYPSVEACFEDVPRMLRFGPVSLELLDSHILSMGTLSPLLKDRLHFLPGHAQALLLAQFETTTPPSVGMRCSKEEEKVLLALRKAGLGLLLSRRSYSRAIAFIEDVVLPPETLSHFYSAFQAILKKHGKEAGIYGQAGEGCLHIRPYIDLREASETALLFHLQEEVADLVAKLGGVLSGKHGDGIIRTHLNKSLFGEKLYRACCELKYLFDPENLLNPGKVVGHLNPKENLRLSPKAPPLKINTFLDFEKEGGFALAVDLCNGNGECRKKTTLMCPSYQACNEERLTTRARAQSLRAIVHGKVHLKELGGKELLDVMDLCLECKGCKAECPSSVNMTKMKAEVLYQSHERHGPNLRTRLFGHIDTLYSWGAKAPSLFNALQRVMPKTLLGMTSKRSLPPLAVTPFSHLQKQKKRGKKKVVLFIDTFTEFCEPQNGIEALKLLQDLDFEVTTISRLCCGRPLYSKGLLKEAQKKALDLMEVLAPFAAENIPIIGLEPSCLLTIQEDYSSLVSDLRSEALTKATVLFDTFLLKNLPLSLHVTTDKEIVIHTHCHQKASGEKGATFALLNHLGARVHELDSGCCGMAGSFGYEKEHYDLSVKIGKERLFPLIPPQALIVANGFSCRTQLHHAAFHSRHLTSILRSG